MNEHDCACALCSPSILSSQCKYESAAGFLRAQIAELEATRRLFLDALAEYGSAARACRLTVDKRRKHYTEIVDRLDTAEQVLFDAVRPFAQNHEDST